MPAAHFVRPSVTLELIIKRVDNAKKNGVKARPYTLLLNIEVCAEKFDEIAGYLPAANTVISDYCNQMISDDHAVWSCVSISSIDRPSIIFYTAGHSVPFYVSYYPYEINI